MSIEKYPNLFKTIEIRGHKYRNRLIAAPTMFAHSIFAIPEMAENVYRMVEARAKGGFAAVATGEICINFDDGIAMFVPYPIDYTKYSGKEFEMMKEYADRIKKHGAIAYIEFCHEAAAVDCEQPYGPDDFVREDGVHVKAMDEAEMQKLEHDMEVAARFAKECGFDGILFHGGHSFMFQQFISPLTNHRTDEYGGSMENRARFPKRIINAMRRGLGEDKIIELRLSAEDGLGVEGEMTIDDTVEFCKLIDGMVDIIHVSTGHKLKGNGTNTFSDFFDIHGVNIEHAAKIKAAVKESKVAVIGGFNDPALCEEVIASGKADFVELARQCFADPEFPIKAMLGREDHIRKCVRCFHCYPGFYEHPTDIPFMMRMNDPYWQKKMLPSSMGDCAINPNSGFANYPDRLPAPEVTKHVLIVGGGPAGMQAAITLKSRGHFVTLVDISARLGGTINFTDVDEDKVDLRNFKDLLIKETYESGADVRLGTSVTKELIDEIKPDQIFIATGSYEIKADIKGAENGILPLETYYNMKNVGQKVVFVGGGLSACECACHLASHGKDVTVMIRGGRMAKETSGYYRNAILTEMDKRHVKQILNVNFEEVKKDGVLFSGGVIYNENVKLAEDGTVASGDAADSLASQVDGTKLFISADTVVMANGAKSNTWAVDSIKEMAGNIPVKLIGDCEKIGQVADAVRSGYNAAMSII